MMRIDRLFGWVSPPEWGRIDSIDAHTAGEPLRIFSLPIPELMSGPIPARRTWMMEHGDSIRRSLMWEPRGHREMYGALVMPPERKDSDVGVLFLHNEGFSTMCGHGIIALATVLVETGAIPASGDTTTIRIDTPAGRVVAEVQTRNGRAVSVSFDNVPSFLSHDGLELDVPGCGRIVMDIAFGGAFYAYVQADQVGSSCAPNDVATLIAAGRAIKKMVAAQVALDHPDDERLNFVYGTIFIAPSGKEGVHSRNVCIFADGQVDRSPTGTGVSGRLAIHHARGEVATGQRITIESIVGTRFVGEVVRTTVVGKRAAIIPRVTGSAFITGQHSFMLSPDDPLKEGFILT